MMMERMMAASLFYSSSLSSLPLARDAKRKRKVQLAGGRALGLPG